MIKVIKSYFTEPFNLIDDTSDVIAGWWVENPDWTDPGNGNEVSSGVDSFSDLGYNMPMLKTGAAAPDYFDSLSNLNGKPGLSFSDSSGDFLEVNWLVYLSEVGGSTAQPDSLAIMFTWTGSAATQYFFDGDGIAYRAMIARTSSNMRLYAGATLNTGTDITANIPYLVVVHRNGTSSRIDVIGNAASDSDTGNAGTNKLYGYHWGSNYTGGSQTDFDSPFAISVDGNIFEKSWYNDFKNWCSMYYGVDGG